MKEIRPDCMKSDREARAYDRYLDSWKDSRSVNIHAVHDRLSREFDIPERDAREIVEQYNEKEGD